MIDSHLRNPFLDRKMFIALSRIGPGRESEQIMSSFILKVTLRLRAYRSSGAFSKTRSHENNK